MRALGLENCNEGIDMEGQEKDLLLINELVKLPSEKSWLEFKKDNVISHLRIICRARL